ncbi:MAG: hypothetical protein R3B45_18235 [Bdellovibrionota bacterium]
MGRRYDHRIRNAIVRSGIPNLFSHLSIPPSTVRDWMRKGEAEVVTIDEFNLPQEKLTLRILELELQLKHAEAQAKLITKTVSILGFQIQYMRVPSGHTKEALINTIKDTARVIGLEACLDIVKLSRARFAAWIVRIKQCTLNDKNTCRRLSPTKLLLLKQDLFATLLQTKNIAILVSAHWLDMQNSNFV